MMRLDRHNLELTRRAWGCRTVAPTARLVLLAYCLHANTAGLCWPSLPRLAALTGLNERTVQRHIRALVAAGLLVPCTQSRAATRAYVVKLQAQPLPTQPQQPELDGIDQPDPAPQPDPQADPMPDLDGWPELDLCFDLDFAHLPELADTLPPLPELGTTSPVDNPAPGGGTVSPHPRQFVPQGVAICAQTPGTAPPKLYELNRTEQRTDRAAPGPSLPTLATPPAALLVPPALPALRPSALPPDVLTPDQQTQQPDPATLSRFAELHQRKGHGPVTAATLDAIKAEGDRAGLTLPQVLAHCVERRWGTFKAVWLQTPAPTRPNGPTPPPGAWTLPGGGQPDPAPYLTPDGRAAARVLADLQAATQQPPASPEQVAHHKAKLAELRARYVASGARVRPASAARAALH